MASYKRRQSSDYNQSVPETQFVPEQHAYQEKHFQPLLNKSVPETRSETEYGATVTPDVIESREEKTAHSTYTEQSDQPGEDDMAKMQIRQNLQNNSEPGTQYSTPDVSSGVSSGPGGFTVAETATAAATTTAASTTVVASSAAATITTVATATAGAAIIAVAFILPLVVGVPSAIIFDEISVTDTTVYYTIFFEDYEEGMDLTVSLHNNFTDRSHKVESHSISVLEENLKPGMSYRLTVYGSMGAVLDERTVKTDKDPSAPALTVKNFDYSPQEGRILMDSELKGDISGLTSFKAVIYSTANNERTVISSNDLETVNGEQTIALNITKDMKYDATFVVEGTNQNGETVELYSKDLTVYGTPYYSAPTFTVSNNTLTVICGYYDPYSARSDYKLMIEIMNSQSQEPEIKEVPLNSGVTTVENISGYAVFEMTAYTQYTEAGTVVNPPEYSYAYNSLDSLVTTGIGRAVAPMVGGAEGNLVITVGDCSEELVAVIRVMDPASGYVTNSVNLTNNVTDTYTFDLLSMVNANVEIEFYVEVFNAINPISGAMDNVVFAHASYEENSLTTAILDPGVNKKPGLEVHFDVNDPYGIWSDYRATVTTSGQSVIELCSNAQIVDNKVYFTVTDFIGDIADITITCVQDGVTVDVAQKRSIEVYSGPSITTNNNLSPGTVDDLYNQTIYLHSKMGEFGSSTNQKTMYAYLLQGDYRAPSAAFTFNDIQEDLSSGYYYITVSFELKCPPFVKGTNDMRLEIRDSDNNLIAGLDDATMIQL